MRGARIVPILCLLLAARATAEPDERLVTVAIEQAGRELELEDVMAMEDGARSKRSAYKKVTKE